MQNKLLWLCALSSILALMAASPAAGQPLPNGFEGVRLRGALSEQQTPNADPSTPERESSSSDAQRHGHGAAESANAPAQATGQEKTNTWAIFGFTEGADTAASGERMPFGESALRLSRRERGSVSTSSNLGFAYGLSDRMVVWVAGSSSYRQSFGDEFGYGQGFGASIGLKYRFLRRESGLLGLSLQGEPFWHRLAERGGVARQVFGSEFRLIVDTALIADDLFAAANIAYAPEISSTDIGYGGCESNLETSLAVSLRVLDDVFVGAEMRHQSKHSGLFFSQEMGSAWFTGPTVYVPLGEKGYFGAAWLIQFHGRAAAEQSRSLDLTNYDRHQVRMKFGYSF